MTDAPRIDEEALNVSVAAFCKGIAPNDTDEFRAGMAEAMRPGVEAAITAYLFRRAEQGFREITQEQLRTLCDLTTNYNTESEQVLGTPENDKLIAAMFDQHAKDSQNDGR